MSTSSSASRGRPVDPTLEIRVFEATLAIYRELGWAGFTLDAVARAARVGKAALYRRWETKEALIVDALLECSRSFPEFSKTGSLRDDLVCMAANMLRFYGSGNGLVILRAQIEAREYPEVLGRAVAEWEKRGRERGRKVIVQAIKRGELPRDTSPAFVLDMVAGTLLNHFLFTPETQMSSLMTNANTYVEGIIAFVLEGIGYRPVVSPVPTGR